MNKYILALIGIIVFVGLVAVGIVGWWIGTHNDLVSSDQDTLAQWGIVESKEQRRYDLIPNIVETVKGFASQEKGVFVGVAEARTRWSNAKSPEDKLQASSGLDSAISRLMMVSESYPELKSDANFMALQTELEGTENRISIERDRYNEIVKIYNKKVQYVPSSIVASYYGYEIKPYFKATENAHNAPKVNFST